MLISLILLQKMGSLSTLRTDIPFSTFLAALLVFCSGAGHTQENDEGVSTWHFHVGAAQFQQWMQAYDDEPNKDGDSVGNTEAVAYMVFILGVLDGLTISEVVCIPSNATNFQIFSLVRKYYADHPEHWGIAPAILVRAALVEPWSCP